MRFSYLTCTLALMAIGNTYAADNVQSPDTSGLSKQEAKDGFKSIFDGKTLDGWQGDSKGYAAENGILICKHPGGGRLFSAKEYDNFAYRFEFKPTPGGNNGIAVRSPLKGSTSRDGIEIQVIDNTADRYKNIKPYQFHGSIYGMVPAKRGYLEPVGQWNSQEIVCDGPHIKITLNGTVIVDANLDDIGETTIDGEEHPGRFRKKGHVGFLGHGSHVEFRNLRIKEF